jgi:2-haloacid dehalogenase/putative hydrolase of the HAD superfamily
VTPDGLLLDAFGTLLESGRNVLLAASERIVADHALPVSGEAFLARWSEVFYALDDEGFYTIEAANRESFARVMDEFGVDATPEPYLDTMVDAWLGVGVHPEVPEVLAALEDVPKAVVSNADEIFLREIFRRHGLRFEHVVTSEAVRVYKPRPAIFRAGLRALGLSANRVVHVGDSQDADILGGKRVGLRVAWVNRRGDTRRADVPPPDWELRDLRGLLPIFGVEP